MKVAIIGGGFAGLSAAYTLTRAGHTVTVFEKEKHLGGLAYGFRGPGWDWHIEAAYHHLFTNDAHILGLIRALGLTDDLIVTRPVTSTLWKNRMYQLDSPLHLMRFPGLSFPDKVRTAFALTFLKFFPFWRILESLTAEQFLVSVGGDMAWRTLWQPLLYGKFGEYAPKVSAAWFWARIVKRTPKLCYIRGGFHTLVSRLEQAITENGGRIRTDTAVARIRKAARGYEIQVGKTKTSFDRVLLTIPTPLAHMIVPELPASYIRPLLTIPHLFAQTLILETDRPLLQSVYWLNVTDPTYPFLAVVAHTNFMKPADYGGRHLTYFGNYLPSGHPYLSMSKEDLFKTFLPHIKKLCPSISRQQSTMNSYMFVGPFAQPVHERHYSQKIPDISTPLPGLYMANMDYVVPWDRGTNYAVELGQRAAVTLLQNAGRTDFEEN